MTKPVTLDMSTDIHGTSGGTNGMPRGCVLGRLSGHMDIHALTLPCAHALRNNGFTEGSDAAYKARAQVDTPHRRLSIGEHRCGACAFLVLKIPLLLRPQKSLHLEHIASKNIYINHKLPKTLQKSTVNPENIFPQSQ